MGCIIKGDVLDANGKKSLLFESLRETYGDEQALVHYLEYEGKNLPIETVLEQVKTSTTFGYPGQYLSNIPGETSDTISLKRKYKVIYWDNKSKKYALNFMSFDKALSISSKLNKENNDYVSAPTRIGQSDSYTVKILKRQDIFSFPTEQKKHKYQILITERINRLNLINNKLADKSKLSKESIIILEARKEKIKEEIEKLKDTESFETVTEFANRDLAEISKLLNKASLSYFESEYINKLLYPYENMVKFFLNEDDFITSETGELGLKTQEVQKIVGIAKTLRERLNTFNQQKIYEEIKKTSPIEVSSEELFSPKKDISYLSSLFRDASTSDFTIVQELDKRIRTANLKAKEEFIDLAKVTKELTDKVIKTPEFKKYGWDLFAQTYKDGKKTGNLTDQYSQEYYDTLKEEIKKAKKSKNWKSFYAWKKENQITLDTRKLFYKEFKEVNSDKTFTEQELKEYEEKLIAELGKDRFEDLKQKTLVKVQQYLEDFAHYKETIINSEEQNKDELIDKWEKTNSPFIYSESIEENKVYKINNKAIFSKGYKYTTEVPHRQWFDSKFEIINSNKDLKEFYDFTITTLNNLYSYLPESITEDFQRNTLPNISKNLLEQFRGNGLKGAFTGFYDNILESLSITTEERAVIKEIDPETGKEVQNLPVFFLNAGFNPEAKSYDVSNVLRVFANMALSYKHKSAIEDEVRLFNRVINSLEEAQFSPTGKILSDKYSNIISDKKGLRNLKNQVDYLMDSFYGKKRDIEGITEKKVELSTGEERVITKGKVADQVLNYIRVKALGWNVFSGVTNSLFGEISNIVYASGRTEFTINDYFSAKALILNSIGKTLSLDSYSSSTAKKIEALMERFQVLGDYQDKYDSSQNEFLSPFKKLLPYEITKRVEYVNYGSTFIAMMLNKKVTTQEGKEVSLWEAFDQEGNLKEGINFTEEERFKFITH